MSRELFCLYNVISGVFEQLLHGSDSAAVAKSVRLHVDHVQPDTAWISARSTTWLVLPRLLRRLRQLGL